jgi:hypothetical protein
VAHLYGSRRNGPEFADAAIRMAISRLRRRLAAHGIDLLTIGENRWVEGYMIDPGQVDKLASLIAGL